MSNKKKAITNSDRIRDAVNKKSTKEWFTWEEIADELGLCRKNNRWVISSLVSRGLLQSKMMGLQSKRKKAIASFRRTGEIPITGRKEQKSTVKRQDLNLFIDTSCPVHQFAYGGNPQRISQHMVKR